MFQTIDTPDPNFSANLSAPEEDIVETDSSNWFAINCCGYHHYPTIIDSIWETDVDE